MHCQFVMIRSDGTQVAVVDDTDLIRLQNVQLGRDFGKSIEIVSGLNDGVRIVTNPTDTLVDGTPVRIAGAPKQTASGNSTHRLAKR